MKNKLTGLNLTDRISVPTQRKMTDAGQMIVPCAFARTGVLIYKGSSLGLTDQADELIKIHRKEEEVFSEDSMESFRSSPVTLGHPKDADGNKLTVTAENAKELQVGILEGKPVRDEDLLTGTLVITNQEAIDKIEEGMVELSAGYTCDIYDEDGTYYQTNIRANHIAIVDKGRAGSSCSIADEDDITEDTSDVGTTPEDKESSISDVESTDSTQIKDLTDDFNAKSEVVKSEQVEDLSEAEAAEAVAVHEENETIQYQYDAEWAEAYAEDSKAMVKAHAEVAKAARKIANKKAKSTTDEAEKGGDTYLTDDVTSILVALDIADETIKSQSEKLKTLTDSIETLVEDRCDVILLAKDMTALDDFKGKSIHQIKSMVVADVKGIDISDKGEAYIEARFDILCEDSGNLETPMSKLLKKQILEDAKPTKIVDVVAEARQRSIDRNNK